MSHGLPQNPTLPLLQNQIYVIIQALFQGFFKFWFNKKGICSGGGGFLFFKGIGASEASAELEQLSEIAEYV